MTEVASRIEVLVSYSHQHQGPAANNKLSCWRPSRPNQKKKRPNDVLMFRRVRLINPSQEIQEEINGVEPRLVGFFLPFGDRFSRGRIQRDPLYDRAQHGLILRASARHRLMKRVKKSKRGSRPEIGYSDDVEEYKPTILLPNAAPQSAEQMGLAGARFTQNHSANWIIRLFPRAQKKIAHDTIDERRV